MYALLSGPQDGPFNYVTKAPLGTLVEALDAAQVAENRGEFCLIYNLDARSLDYSTEGVASATAAEESGA